MIGTLGGVAIVAGSMLGIGIFLTPAPVAGHLPSFALYFLAWLLSGVIAFCGAVAYGELGARFPRAGGDYEFLREAFGPSISFAAGWLLFAGVFAGSVATMSVPLAQYQLPVLLGPLVTFDPGAVIWAFGGLEVTAAQVVAVGIVAVLTAINILGTRLSTGVQIALTAVPVVLFGLASLLVLLLVEPSGQAVSLPTADLSDPFAIRFGRAILAIYFAYAGWNAIAYVGGEMDAPGRTIPRSLLGGTALITALYLLMASAFVVVLGMDGLRRAFEAGTATAEALGGERAAYGVTVLIATALLGSLNGTILAGARVGLAMARRGALWSGAGVLHERFKTPATALSLLAALALVLILTGTFEMLLELTGVAMLVMGTLVVLALFRIRRRDGLDAPYLATGYPFTPLFYVVVSVFVIIASLARAFAPGQAMTLETLYPLIGLGIFAGTWLVHRVVVRTSEEV